MTEEDDEVCELCGHSLKDNLHGIDQNDIRYDEALDTWVHTGTCTYCKECH